MSGPMTVRRRHGFTMIELLIVVIVGLLVLGSVYRVLISQSKEYENHRETIDIEETLRGAAALLTSELQVASASRGDLYAIGPDSISLRSFQTSGAICGQVVNVNRYAVWQPSGSFTAAGSLVRFDCTPGAPPPVRAPVVCSRVVRCVRSAVRSGS